MQANFEVNSTTNKSPVDNFIKDIFIQEDKLRKEFNNINKLLKLQEVSNHKISRQDNKKIAAFEKTLLEEIRQNNPTLQEVYPRQKQCSYKKILSTGLFFPNVAKEMNIIEQEVKNNLKL